MLDRSILALVNVQNIMDHQRRMEAVTNKHRYLDDVKREQVVVMLVL
jgi:hypothetical protein